MKQYSLSKARKSFVLTSINSDDWFYSVTEVTGSKREYKGMILKKEVPVWINLYQRKGFSVREEDI